MSFSILQVNDLRVYYHLNNHVVKAVDGVSFDIQAGERFGLVGESGSGKSTIAMAILGLIKPPGKIESGEIWFRPSEKEELKPVNLRGLSEEQFRKLRLAGISLIPQGAMSSLNPLLRIHTQLLDGIRDHGILLSRHEQNSKICELLESVGLRKETAKMYPHELSGGMKQRVAIAMATSLRPRLIIADEPTSALDVIVQRQVMETLCEMQERIQASVLIVGHDMGLMAQSVRRIGVMRAGKLVEVGTVSDVFNCPQDSYTKMLIASLPSLIRKSSLS
ncbi:MAG: ABC transporter ATP-binding protein [Flexilinea sp.]